MGFKLLYHTAKPPTQVNLTTYLLVLWITLCVYVCVHSCALNFLSVVFKIPSSWAQQHIPVIPVTYELETGRSQVQAQAQAQGNLVKLCLKKKGQRCIR